MLFFRSVLLAWRSHSCKTPSSQSCCAQQVSLFMISSAPKGRKKVIKTKWLIVCDGVGFQGDLPAPVYSGADEEFTATAVFGKCSPRLGQRFLFTKYFLLFHIFFPLHGPIFIVKQDTFIKTREIFVIFYVSVISRKTLEFVMNKKRIPFLKKNQITITSGKELFI